ncbi:HNH endonuclease [Lentibacillus cibarius]|uniref:HNH endonuclease n=1 Tax=Lentibacillus cibarius TaxID=2583219 RepID=A0A5S3QJE1_9BACI|nr:HNH endonuclease [Lentibacillus cibarius]TMN21847.1 HNH endonuclease [Lentibacillus cibarius]
MGVRGVSTGDTCRLYKRCKICGEYKYMKSFPATGGKHNRPSKRKSYCRDCKDRRHERILGPRQEYSFDSSLLDATKEITIRGRNTSNYKYENIISYDKAKRLVEEGAAGIVHSTLIHHFFNRKTLWKFVLERDGFICHYCGFYGDTIDHKVPRAKGGASTPSNCVCACIKCNRNKDDIEYEEYIDIVELTEQN